MLDVRVRNLSLKGLLASPPVISDQLDAVCRTLDISLQASAEVEIKTGEPIELWYKGERWFFGYIRKKTVNAQGGVSLLAYDPLYFLKKTKDDFYFTNATATQGFKELARAANIAVYSLANTGTVFKALYYPGADAEKVAVDLIARTYEKTNKKYWYRYRPNLSAEGLHLFERVVPAKLWAFQVGINLTAAEYSESMENTVTVVKLVDRETGKVVTKEDSKAISQGFGRTMHFEEVNKDESATMELKATKLLEELSKLDITMKIEAVNTMQALPQFFSGDVIYIEEKRTKLLGAYHILNVTQTFVNDNLVNLAFDVQQAPDVPTVQYADAIKGKEG